MTAYDCRIPHRKGKVLIIGGGIANFTNVAATFKGIQRALQVLASPSAQGTQLHNDRDTGKHTHTHTPKGGREAGRHRRR